MAQSFNIFILEGRLGNNAELKQAGNYQITSFPVAANLARAQNNQDGPVTWIQCASFLKQHQNLIPSLTKGLRVLVTGRLEINIGQDGKQYHNLNLTELRILDSMNQQNNAQQPGFQQPQQPGFQQPGFQQPQQPQQPGFQQPQQQYPQQNTGFNSMDPFAGI